MSELDRLLAAAREATPEPLGDAEAEVLLERAKRRAHASRLTIVERVLTQARAAEPDPLTEPELHAMAERAAMTGRARHRGWTRRRVMMTSALAATAAAAAVTLMLSKPAPVDPPRAARAPVASEPSELTLSSGDRLVALSGARFDVEIPDSDTRRVRLRGGAMLFDVRPIEGGRFSVSTPNAEVEVLGTVFSVRATERATTVWVYEGTVRVRGPDGARVLEAGGVIHLGAGAAGADALATAGEAAADRRAAEPAPSTEEPLERPEPDPPPSEERRASRAHAEPERVPDSARTTPAEARELITDGHPERALAIVRAAIDRDEHDPWRMLEGDALRVLHRLDEAADAYQRAARELPPPRRQQAGFLEARLRMTLNDPSGALRALRSADVTAADSALRERGLVLELELLHRLDRRAEAALVAREYLRDYPEGPDAAAMRAHAFSSE